MRCLVVLAAWLLASGGFGTPAAGAADPDLIAAIKAIDAPRVRAALARGADPSETDPDGTTPLHWAVHSDAPTVVELLLEAGADVEAANRYGVRPLMLACTNGNAQIAEILLDAGADANTTGSEGETVLMIAARTGSAEVVRRLLGHGADPNVTETWRGQTALMWAAAEGHAIVIPPLLANGADFTIRSATGWNALLFAVREGQINVVQTLLEAGANVEDKLPVVKQMRESTSIRPGATGLNAFLLAAANAHYELAALLIDHGADVNVASRGWSALHQVTWVRKAGIAGSNNPSPKGSGTMSSLDFVRKLVMHGADVNARVTVKPPAGITRMNFIDGTPFLLAARTADADLMRLLADLGADPLLPNADLTSPIIIAAGVGSSAPGEDPGTESEVIEAVRVALELGGNINAVDAKGETVMHGAAYKHLEGLVPFLMEAGADITVWNQPNAAGKTPLDIVTLIGGHPGENVAPDAPTADAIREAIKTAGGTPPPAD